MSKFFPLYIDLRDKNLLFVGAGKIALRRLKSLILFDINIRIIAKNFNSELENLLKNKNNIKANISFFERAFEERDLEDTDIVFICTDDRILNKKISNLAKDKNIMYNNASDKEESNFYFPSMILNDDICIALASENAEHKYTKELRIEIEKKLDLKNKIDY